MIGKEIKVKIVLFEKKNIVYSSTAETKNENESHVFIFHK